MPKVFKEYRSVYTDGLCVCCQYSVKTAQVIKFAVKRFNGEVTSLGTEKMVFSVEGSECELEVGDWLVLSRGLMGSYIIAKVLDKNFDELFIPEEHYSILERFLMRVDRWLS